MSSVIDLRAYVNPSVIQTLVLVDLQQEYIASPRVLALEETKGALANCRAALAHARAMGLPVAFVRWIDRTPLFNKATPLLALDRGLRAARRRHDLRAQPAVLLRERGFRRGDERGRRQLRARGLCRRGGVPRDRDRCVPSRPHVSPIWLMLRRAMRWTISRRTTCTVWCPASPGSTAMYSRPQLDHATSRRGNGKGLGDGTEQGRTA